MVTAAVPATDDVAGEPLPRLSDEAVVVDAGALVAAVATTVVTVDADSLLRLSWATIGGATTSDKDDLVILSEYASAVDTTERTVVSISLFRSIDPSPRIDWLGGVGSQCISLAR